ncbi:MAG: ornithine cyclodeaminase family protein [Deferrisomatales bacterium]
MLVLGENDLLGAVSRPELMDEIERALVLQERGECTQPPRAHLDRGEDTLLLMPCFAGEFFGTKLVTVFPGNAARNAPVVDAVMVLNRGDTGEAVALLNGRVLTALRTGAVGGLGVRHLSPPETRRLGVVGAGAQGFYQALFAATARPITDIHVFDRHGQGVPAFLDRLAGALPGVRVHQAPSAEALLEASETVITATTSSAPVLPDDEGLLRGRHFVGIGSFKPTMREFPEALFRLVNRVYVDTGHAAQESGDLAVPLAEGWLGRDRVVPLGRLLTGAAPERGGETTLFKSVGMALFDLCAAGRIYRNAVDRGLGQRIAL